MDKNKIDFSKGIEGGQNREVSPKPIYVTHS